MSYDLEYGMDPQGRFRFYGIYSAKVISIDDPANKSRIQVQIQGPTGQQVTGWAKACLPITSNSNHPDHIAHTAAQVAALLSTHDTHSISVTGTTGGATVSTFGSHTHTFSSSTTAAHTAHAGVSGGKLEHPHKTVANTTEKWNDSQETNTTAEHTPHRIVATKNQLVWVMFEAGDPEYPVWIGVQG